MVSINPNNNSRFVNGSQQNFHKSIKANIAFAGAKTEMVKKAAEESTAIIGTLKGAAIGSVIGLPGTLIGGAAGYLGTKTVVKKGIEMLSKLFK